MSKTIDEILDDEYAVRYHELSDRTSSKEWISMRDEYKAQMKQAIQEAIERANPDVYETEPTLEKHERQYRLGYNNGSHDFLSNLLQELGLDDSVKYRHPKD